MDNCTKNWKKEVKKRLRALARNPSAADAAAVRPQDAAADAAIRQAMEETGAMRNGADRLCLVNMVHIRRTHTIQGAAIQCAISCRTAERWNQAFLRRAVQLVEQSVERSKADERGVEA